MGLDFFGPRRLGPQPEDDERTERARVRFFEQLTRDIQEQKMPKTARCKFMVDEVAHFRGESRRIKLNTQYDEALSKEDRAFAKATPSGSMEVVISNPNVFDVFQLGKTVYVDITPCEE